MKRVFAVILILVWVLALAACAPKVYKVEFAEEYPIVNELQETYAPGEEITVKLEATTEGYYSLYVNGVAQQIASSDLEGTCFTFTMPKEDVLIKVELHTINIPGIS